jgi:hypothetical protein
MAMLLKTTVTNGHWHLVHVDQAGQKFTLSTDKDHSHQVTLFADPLTGEPQTNVSLEGEPLHSHELTELENALPTKPKKESDEEVLQKAIALFKHAVDIEKPSRDKSHESCRFFKGEQWTPAEKQALNAKARATQVYNYTQSFVDSLSGLARQNRLDPRAFPIEGSDDGVADIVTAVLTWIAKRSNLSQQEIRVFEDEVVPGRGLFHIDVTQRSNPLGDVVIERFPWADGYFGVHHELDASDATHCHKAKWVAFQEAIERWPHVKDELETQLQLSHDYPEELDDRQRLHNMLAADEELIDKAHRRIRVIEHEIKETRQAYFIGDQTQGTPIEVDHASFRKADTIPGLNLMEFPKERIRIVVTVGSLLVKNYYPDRPYDGFSLVPVYAYKFDDNDWCGKVESMKDAQREINKRGSQAIDIVNRMLGQGYFYDDETFNDDKDKDAFKRDSGKPGFALKVANSDRPPTPATHPPFPTELLNLHRQNVDIMQTVSNIPPALVGQGTGYESNQALQTQKQGALVGNERIFDNFVLSKQAVFKKVFKLVQKFYTKERIARLVLSSVSDPTRMENARIGGQEIPQQRTPDEDQILMQHITEMLETANLEEYDIAIGEQPMSPTAREAQFRLWLEAQNHGLPVPPGMLIELSALPNKGKWARQMQEMQQQAQETERMKFEAEMAKAGRTPPPGNPNGGTR